MSYLENYYANYDEEGRLVSKHGRVEFLTTMKYIHESIGGGATKFIRASKSHFKISAEYKSFEY